MHPLPLVAAESTGCGSLSFVATSAESSLCSFCVFAPWSLALPKGGKIFWGGLEEGVTLHCSGALHLSKPHGECSFDNLGQLSKLCVGKN